MKLLNIHVVAGLAGKTDIEQAKVDMILECMEDTIKMVPAIFRAPDEEKKVQPN